MGSRPYWRPPLPDLQQPWEVAKWRVFSEFQLIFLKKVEKHKG